MASTNGPITELVQIPLAISFTEFLDVFSKRLEPVLLAQPGLRSVMTGVTIPKNDGKKPFAVSLTQWDSLEAHEAFGNSQDAGPFFDTLKPLATGPPTIEHYYLGHLESAIGQSRYSQILKFSVGGGDAQEAVFKAHVTSHGKAAALQGHCVEVDGQTALVLFDDGRGFTPAPKAWKSDDISSSFIVQWHRLGTGKISAAL
ncbi:hypothetical protein QQX98_008665 [Neonectria punicea]|uniref:ABM domain-containing protein n=1 Tax=Neonectria punicea TaxID=979145 RepID=A0ABR1GUJ4_9HYPO